jgi:bacillithiol system protein YtxJ
VDVIAPVLIALGAVFAVRMAARFRAGKTLMALENCTPVPSVEDLRRILDGTDSERSILFLHDPWCPVSRRAAREIEYYGGPVALVDVSKQHEMNREIASRTGIRHESPQVIVFASGQPVWNASHGGITSRDIEAAWTRAGQVAGAAD